MCRFAVIVSMWVSLEHDSEKLILDSVDKQRLFFHLLACAIIYGY